MAFGAFVIWNGGIVLGTFTGDDKNMSNILLGDKKNHIPVVHIPQLFYFVAFATLFAWPVLLSYEGGPLALLRDVKKRMVGSTEYAILLPFNRKLTNFFCKDGWWSQHSCWQACLLQSTNSRTFYSLPEMQSLNK